MKVKNPIFIQVFHSLKYLSEKETDVHYPVGKNMRRMLTTVQLIEADKNAIFDKLGEKDETGKLKTKLVNGMEMLDFDSIEKEKACMDAIKEWEKEEVGFEFHHIDIAKLEGLQLAAGAIDALFGTVIIEEDEVEDKFKIVPEKH